VCGSARVREIRGRENMKSAMPLPMPTLVNGELVCLIQVHFAAGWRGRICSRLKIDAGIEVDARVDSNQVMCLWGHR
jgi:hypothetical protein